MRYLGDELRGLRWTIGHGIQLGSMTYCTCFEEGQEDECMTPESRGHAGAWRLFSDST